MVHLVAEAGVAVLIQSEELIQAIRAAVRHQEAMEGHGESHLSERLDGLRFPQNPCARGDEYLPPRMRIERVGYETVDGRRARAVQAIRENRVDDGPFQHAM